MTKVVIYQEDGSFIERVATEAELELEAKDYAEWLQKKALKDKAKAAAEAKLAALGLTTDDLKALGLN